jgi:hypothetical protein
MHPLLGACLPRATRADRDRGATFGRGRRPDQARAIGQEGWQRIAGAIGDLNSTGPDVLVDAGRLDSDTALPLLAAADLVLLAVRPHTRHVAATYAARHALRRTVADERLGLTVCCASRSLDSRHRILTDLDLPVCASLPDDPATAAVFSEATTAPSRRALRRGGLVRAAERAAQRLAVSSCAGTDMDSPGSWCA